MARWSILGGSAAFGVAGDGVAAGERADMGSELVGPLLEAGCSCPGRDGRQLPDGMHPAAGARGCALAESSGPSSSAPWQPAAARPPRAASPSWCGRSEVAKSPFSIGSAWKPRLSQLNGGLFGMKPTRAAATDCASPNQGGSIGTAEAAQGRLQRKECSPPPTVGIASKHDMAYRGFSPPTANYPFVRGRRHPPRPQTRAGLRPIDHSSHPLV